MVLLLFLALNIVIVKVFYLAMFLRYVSMLDYGPVSLLKTINVSYPIWLMQTSVCGSSIADHSCLILFLYTSSVILIVIWTTGQISAWQNQAMISVEDYLVLWPWIHLPRNNGFSMSFTWNSDPVSYILLICVDRDSLCERNIIS